ncbi:MAG: FAD-dependent oxidoreductase, partial [Candidatus Firestonebacteria bacterium]
VLTMRKYVLPQGKNYGIPFSSMKPAGCENLLLTGRHISVDRMAHGSTRVMPACMAIGEAAGLAAAMAAKENITVSKIDTDELRKRLVRQGGKVQ